MCDNVIFWSVISKMKREETSSTILPNSELQPQNQSLVVLHFLTSYIDITTWGPFVGVVDRTAYQSLNKIRKIIVLRY